MHPFERIADAVRDDGFKLHEHIMATKLPPHVELGQRGVHHPTLDLREYVVSGHPTLENPPPAVHRSNLGFPFGMLMNDHLGCCGPAMVIHGIEAFHLDAQTPVPPFGDQDCERLYERAGGYDPSQTQPDGSNPTDRGVDNTDLVKCWEEGVTCQRDNSSHQAVATIFVDPKDLNLNKLAIWEFVVLFRAVALPVTAQGQSWWKVTDPSLQGDAAPGSWGGHDIPYLSYDAHGVRNVTWGEELLVDWDFDAAYAMQGFVVVTREQLNLQGVSPAGVDWTKLNQDIAKLPSAQH